MKTINEIRTTRNVCCTAGIIDACAKAAAWAARSRAIITNVAYSDDRPTEVTVRGRELADVRLDLIGFEAREIERVTIRSDHRPAAVGVRAAP